VANFYWSVLKGCVRGCVPSIPQGFNLAYHCRKLEGWSNGQFKWIWSHWMLIC